MSSLSHVSFSLSYTLFRLFPSHFHRISFALNFLSISLTRTFSPFHTNKSFFSLCYVFTNQCAHCYNRYDPRLCHIYMYICIYIQNNLKLHNLGKNASKFIYRGCRISFRPSLTLTLVFFLLLLFIFPQISFLLLLTLSLV